MLLILIWIVHARQELTVTAPTYYRWTVLHNSTNVILRARSLLTPAYRSWPWHYVFFNNPLSAVRVQI